MSTLLSGHGADDDALAAARRRARYSRLVLLSSAPDDPALAELRENETLAGVDVQVVAVDPADLLACLRAANGVLLAGRAGGVRVHAGGGPNLVASALVLAAFERGVEAFWCHARGVTRFPVAAAVDLAERFSDDERRLLVAMPTRGTLDVEPLSGPEKRSLRALRDAGLVHADARRASLTATGRHYRAHFVR